jgi:hypothetical protein
MTDLPDHAPKEVLYNMGISRRLLTRLASTDRWRTIGDIRYTPDLELRREPQMGRLSIAELRTFVPYVAPGDADLSLWERCCSGRAAVESVASSPAGIDSDQTCGGCILQ